MTLRQFDRISRTLHRGLSRRTALRSIGGGGLAAALATSGHGAAAHQEGTPTLTYEIEGRLLEVCTCGVLCPCWVGEDPDGGTCESAMAWGVDKGNIEGVDVAGRVVALSVHIPGNALAGNWRVVVYVDDGATQEQQDVLLKVFTGQLGGAIADLASLIGEVIAVERAPISFTVDEGEGRLTIGSVVDAELAPLRGATGELTVLNETVFSTIPGSPVFVGKAGRFFRDGESHGLSSLEITGRNALQGYFRFAA